MIHPSRGLRRAASVATLLLLVLAHLRLAAQEPAPAPKPLQVSTPEFMAKMLQLVTDKGTNREMPANFAKTLGFATPDHPWRYRGIIGSDDDEHQHSFNFGLGSSREIAVVIRDLKSIRANRVDSSGKVLVAIEIDLATGDYTLRTPAEAQNEVNAEIDLWNGKVDDLLAQKKPSNLPAKDR